ncbi:MAG: DNA cytosine methyltransferase [Elusimicrobiales bacterium]|nr:DNA cytosine methyltransferase [Elusimicrobiales bacterium]
MKTIRAVDMFCGAGGTSTGLYAAADELGYSVDLLAINHWKVAIATHSANHNSARHMCETLDSVDPRKAIPSGHLHLMVASPECTHHSNARGGKPMSDQSRASAWHVLRWAEALRIDNIIIENVREFMSWGPLGADGRPLKSRRGETFQAFINALRSLGYTADYRILNAADYGDPTTRERLFVLAHRGRKAIKWPEPTHSRAKDTLFQKAKPWRAAREIIDWTIPGKSIFERDRPLAPNTLRRIEVGLRKFGGKELEPFLIMLYGSNKARDIKRPMPTVTATGQHVALCEPIIIPLNHGKKDSRAYPANRPFPTVTSTDSWSVVQPFILGQQSCAAPRGVDKPLPTVATAGAISLVEPFIVPFFGERKGQKPRCHSVKKPLPAVTGQGAGALVEPILIQYYGNGQSTPVSAPLPTVTGKDHFALVSPDMQGARLDIRFRMLQPHELARAQGFPTDYKFTGNRGEQVKQIGNAVPTHLAQALCRAALENL